LFPILDDIWAKRRRVEPIQGTSIRHHLSHLSVGFISEPGLSGNAFQPVTPHERQSLKEFGDIQESFPMLGMPSGIVTADWPLSLRLSLTHREIGIQEYRQLPSAQ
jgi:hypothetical protein